ncbi:MAG: hypothetical protein KGO05_03355 [Chloroflexota bacterium]|nr:hypothetical protein [Chloroflexota bacterium]
MRPEEELDARLSEPTQAQSVSRELAPLLAAAARLAPLRDARPDHTFADDLEAQLLVRLGQRPSAPPRRLPVVAPRVAWAAVAAILLITISLGALTAKAAPGAPLYGVRQFAQTLAARAAGTPAADPYAALGRAQADLSAYDAASASHDTSAALAALARLRADDASAAKDAAALSDASARQRAQARISAFQQGAATDLRASLTWLAWQPRAQVTDALRAWGDASLAVAQITIRPGSAATHPTPANASDTTLLVEAHGDGFVTGTRLLVNGAPVGATVSLSATQVVFRVAASALQFAPASHSILAIQNPDGTVAMSRQTEHDDHGASSDTTTPAPDGHSGDQGTATAVPNATTSPDGAGASDNSGGASSASGA